MIKVNVSRCMYFDRLLSVYLKQNFAGEDLLSIAADQPFRFPATFTFVVRAFSGMICNNLCTRNVVVT